MYFIEMLCIKQQNLFKVVTLHFSLTSMALEKIDILAVEVERYS